jgi:hypothetical protein
MCHIETIDLMPKSTSTILIFNSFREDVPVKSELPDAFALARSYGMRAVSVRLHGSGYREG